MHIKFNIWLTWSWEETLENDDDNDDDVDEGWMIHQNSLYFCVCVCIGWFKYKKYNLESNISSSILTNVQNKKNLSIYYCFVIIIYVMLAFKCFIRIHLFNVFSVVRFELYNNLQHRHTHTSIICKCEWLFIFITPTFFLSLIFTSKIFIFFFLVRMH